MGYLPLGITQAAEVIVKDSCFLTDFLDAYNDRELIQSTESLRSVKRPGQKYTHTLSTVWNMSFESLDHDQQKFLNVISFLDPDRVQLKLLLEGSAISVKKGILSLSFMDDIRKLNRCKGPVVRSSLLTQNEKLRELWLHRLVQQSCHIRMDPMTRQESFDMAYSLVKTMWPVPARNDRHRVDIWPTQRAYFAHIQSMANFYHASQQENEMLQAGLDFIGLITDAALYVWSHCNLSL